MSRTVTRNDGRQCGEAQAQRNSVVLSIIRAIHCGPSNYDKSNVLINLLESPNGVRFENEYDYSKSLEQPKYRYLNNLFTSIDEIDYFKFSNNSDVVSPSEERKFYFSLITWQQAEWGERILFDGPPRERRLLLSVRRTWGPYLINI